MMGEHDAGQQQFSLIFFFARCFLYGTTVQRMNFFLSFLAASLIATAHCLVYDGSTTVTGYPSFSYVTKFAFDPSCHNSSDCTITLSWTAYENTTGYFAFYDEDTWPTAMQASSCEEAFNDRLPSGTQVEFSGTANITVYVHEYYQHWWYVAILNCNGPINVEYEITFLNEGSQFGYNEQGMLPLYVFYFVLQALAILALTAYKRFSFLTYRVSAFVAVSMLIECMGLLLSVLHWATYSVTGQGVVESGNWLEELATCVLFAGILHGAAGWNANAINSYGQYSGRIYVALIVIVSGLYISLLIWAIIVRNYWWYQDYIYESVPGAIVMAFRMLAGVWFVAQLIHTTLKETNISKRRVYIQFGVVSFLWLWSIPISAFIGFAIPSYYQLKVESTLFITFDTLTFFSLLYILRPSVVEAYFTVAALVNAGLAATQPPLQLQEEFLTTGDREENKQL